MNNRTSWLGRGALAVTLLCTAVLGVGTSHAEVTATPTRLGGARYRLQAVATGAPCDAWQWTVLAGADAMLVPDDQPTVEAVVGVGLYIFQATCIREGGESESTVVTIDTRPSGGNDLPAFKVWDLPFEGPVCLTCPDWIAPLDESIFDIRQEGAIRTDIDFSTFGDFAAELGADPTPDPMIPQGIELSFGGIDTFTSSVDGEDLGTGLTLTGYTHDGFERITTGAFNIGKSGMVVAAFLLEAGDASPQPS